MLLRITSYNVCYTKLLRNCERSFAERPRARVLALRSIQTGEIFERDRGHYVIDEAGRIIEAHVKIKPEDSVAFVV